MEYYNTSLIQAITKLTSEYKRLAAEKGIDLEDPKPITMGMWIGGDRDGNPYVTAETLRLSATVQSEVIINYYIEKLTGLYRTFSLSTTLTNISPEVEKLAELSSDKSIYRENEPYRKAFNYIQSKLIQTLIELKASRLFLNVFWKVATALVQMFTQALTTLVSLQNTCKQNSLKFHQNFKKKFQAIKQPKNLKMICLSSSSHCLTMVMMRS